jgi:hypothetical protein
VNELQSIFLRSLSLKGSYRESLAPYLKPLLLMVSILATLLACWFLTRLELSPGCISTRHLQAVFLNTEAGYSKVAFCRQLRQGSPVLTNLEIRNISMASQTLDMVRSHQPPLDLKVVISRDPFEYQWLGRDTVVVGRQFLQNSIYLKAVFLSWHFNFEFDEFPWRASLRTLLNSEGLEEFRSPTGDPWPSSLEASLIHSSLEYCAEAAWRPPQHYAHCEAFRIGPKMLRLPLSLKGEIDGEIKAHSYWVSRGQAWLMSREGDIIPSLPGEHIHAGYLILASCEAGDSTSTLEKFTSFLAQHKFDRVLIAQTCSEWTAASMRYAYLKGVDSLASRLEGVSLTLFHIPSLESALRHRGKDWSVLNKREAWPQLFAWHSHTFDKRISVFRPVANYEGVVYYR